MTHGIDKDSWYRYIYSWYWQHPWYWLRLTRGLSVTLMPDFLNCENSFFFVKKLYKWFFFWKKYFKKSLVKQVLFLRKYSLVKEVFVKQVVWWNQFYGGKNLFGYFLFVCEEICLVKKNLVWKKFFGHNCQYWPSYHYCHYCHCCHNCYNCHYGSIVILLYCYIDIFLYCKISKISLVV